MGERHQASGTCELPPNGEPWLILQNTRYEMPNCLAYCFSTGAWKKIPSISLSFLFGGVEKDYVVFSDRSAAGLFLVEIGHAFCSPKYFIVCNPLTRTTLRLPPVSTITTIILRGIVLSDNRDTYQVVAVGDSGHRGPEIVEVFDSTDKSWRIVGHLPRDVRIIKTEMAFSSEYFYCLTMAMSGNMNPGILGFSIRDGSSIFVPLPETTHDKYMMPHVLACGSRVLLVGDIAENEELLEVVIWEFEKVNLNSSSSSSWKEITKMPSSMCEGFNRTLPDVNFPFSIIQVVGVGDCACIVNNAVDTIEGLVYGLSQNSWSLLTSCPLDGGISDNIGKMGIMAFEPRPDMKVG